MAQKLSPTARRDKAARDKRYAMTPRRRRMKAENQRLRRAAEKIGVDLTNKDYDHNTESFTSVSENRGNRGKGTKNE
tara:strand:- start:1460 stop:1690 length:231 start_codon:yes stop_codon:yes gene_type:complete